MVTRRIGLLVAGLALLGSACTSRSATSDTTTSSTAPTSSTSSTAPATSQQCGSVAFTAEASSQGAFDITVTGADCATARAVATAAKGRGGASYSSSGYSCPAGGTSPTNGMAYFTYRCVNGPAFVTFNEQG